MVGAELVELAKEIMEDARRGQKFYPPLDWREITFYDAIASHETTHSVMGDEILAAIARDLIPEVRSKLKPEWIFREPVLAPVRSAICRLLARYDCPPDRRLQWAGTQGARPLIFLYGPAGTRRRARA